MLQVARLAPKLLGDAAAAVEAFLQQQWHDDGGGCDRAGASDLYYTVFTLEGLLALQADVPAAPLSAYLARFGDGDELDTVHLACLARCWASAGMAGAEPARDAAAIAANLQRACPDPRESSVYHAFLVHGAYQDLGVEHPDPSALLEAVMVRRSSDGAFANTPGMPVGSTTVTAAAVTLLRQLDQDVPAEVGDWLLQRAFPDGGFLAAPRAPAPDLLSTATALHALAGMKVDFTPLREPCLDFIDTLWTGRAFCGHWADDAQDSEYTYYALLALGHASL